MGHVYWSDKRDGPELLERNGLKITNARVMDWARLIWYFRMATARAMGREKNPSLSPLSTRVKMHARVSV